jgi:hypothetical protein
MNYLPIPSVGVGFITPTGVDDRASRADSRYPAPRPRSTPRVVDAARRGRRPARPRHARARPRSTPRVEGGDRHARSGPERPGGRSRVGNARVLEAGGAAVRSAREARRSAAASAASAPRRARWVAPGSRRGRRVGPLPLRRRDGRVGVGPLPLQRARRSALRADGRPGVGARARVAHLLEDVLHRAPRSLRVDVLGQEPVHLGDRRRRRLAPARPRGAGPARLGSGIRASAPSRAGPACPE